jgi:TonB family protein
MKIAEPYCQSLMNRRPVLRLAVVLLGVMISVATWTEHAAAQGTSSDVAAPVRDSLALELLKAMPSGSRIVVAMMYVYTRLGAILPSDAAQRSRIVRTAVAAFDTTYATDSAVFGSVAHTYAVRFTERELRELIAYERMRPEIEKAVTLASESVVTSHRAQLNDMVRNAVGDVTGSTPAPIAPGPLVSVSARPPFLPNNAADVLQPTSTARTGGPCADTGRAPAAAFRGPPFGVPEAGSSGVILLGDRLGAPIVEALVPVAYPPVLQASGIQGTVTVRYWVNPAGCAEPESIQVKQASDSAMAVAVRDAVRRMHFIERGPSGETLWTSVDQVFTFRITP